MNKIISLAITLVLSLCVFSTSISTANASVGPAAKKATTVKAPTGELKHEQFLFGYVDASGKQILGSGDLYNKKPNRFTKVYSAPGKSENVTYIKHQDFNDKGTGRQTANNFKNDAGELFKLNPNQPKLKANDSVLLAEPNAFVGHQFLSFKSVQKVPFSSSLIQKIEKIKGLKVENQGLIAQVSTGEQFGAVQFKRIGNQAPLASLILVTKNGILFQDFVGNKDSESTWRVEDEGVFEAIQFDLMFITRSKAGYALSYEWQGSEGNSANLVQQKGNNFHTIQAGGRYMYPI